MPRSRDLLRRFRLSGTPGGAATEGVPVDHAAQAEAELEPVLALLEDAQMDARRIRKEASEEASRRIRHAEEQARASVAAAQGNAAALRAETASGTTLRGHDEITATLAAADARAARITSEAMVLLPEHVADVMATLRAELLPGADA